MLRRGPKEDELGEHVEPVFGALSVIHGSRTQLGDALQCSAIGLRISLLDCKSSGTRARRSPALTALNGAHQPCRGARSNSASLVSSIPSPRVSASRLCARPSTVFGARLSGFSSLSRALPRIGSGNEGVGGNSEVYSPKIPLTAGCERRSAEVVSDWRGKRAPSVSRLSRAALAREMTGSSGVHVLPPTTSILLDKIWGHAAQLHSPAVRGAKVCNPRAIEDARREGTTAKRSSGRSGQLGGHALPRPRG